MFAGEKISRIHLPTYPFARERYWVPKVDVEDRCITTSGDSVTFSGVQKIHPLLHQNTSNLSEQRFSSTFTGREFFLADHVVKGQRVLPGVTYLEMARAAIVASWPLAMSGPSTMSGSATMTSATGIRIKNVVWARPIVVSDQPVQINIGLFPEEGASTGDDGEIAYEVYSEPEEDSAEVIIHSQGSAVLNSIEKAPVLDLPALKVQCNQNIFSSNQCYEVFKAMGFEYGPGHQGIKKIYLGSTQVLAELSLPSSVFDTKEQFFLHPSMMDAALQAGLMMNSDNWNHSSTQFKPALPFALHELEILGNCTPNMWALIRYSGGTKVTDTAQKLDIDICDDRGTICVRMKGISSRVLEGEVGAREYDVSSSQDHGTLVVEPVWKERAIVEGVPVPEYDQYWTVLCEPEVMLPKSINNQMKGIARAYHCLTLQSNHTQIEKRFQTYALQVFEEIQRILNDKPKHNVLIQIVVSTKPEQQLFTGLFGLLKTAQLENPKLIGQLIEIEPGENSAGLIAKLKENSRSPIHNRIRYQDGKRWVAEWSEVTSFKEGEVKIPWKERGIYLITGGAGGLGLIFAKEIAERAKDVTLILTGRATLNEEKQAKLEELRSFGARVDYRQVDVTQKKAVEQLIQDIKENYGSLHGIIHSAGIIKDNYIIKKTMEELQEVLLPKVTGLVNLDLANQDLDLDFFILFSSMAGSLGNPGQADYATANAFMDAYAQYRNTLVTVKQRHGRTLSINWPLWKEGGMHVDEVTEKTMMQNWGMAAMRTQTGIQSLYQGLVSGKDQVMVMEGKVSRIKQKILSVAVPSSETTFKESIPEVDPITLKEKTIHQLKMIFGEITKLDIGRIDADESFEVYGIDSIMITQLNQKFADIFGDLSKTLFFEYKTLRELSEYLVADYAQSCIKWTGLQEQSISMPKVPSPVMRFEAEFPELTSLKAKRKNKRSYDLAPIDGAREPIAIIGMSGRYPQAKNLREYWENLETGKDCISEIPTERWPLAGFYHADSREAVADGKSYSKWGGFVDGFADFDPLFFNISPRETLNLDPQERLFVESCWEVLEDAGYTKGQLETQYNRRIGVFAGITKTGFDLYGPDLKKQGEQVYPHTSFSSVANRISYLLNLQGPSMPVDTMCSASLTAIHEACEYLYRGECEMAFAGGVNLYLHPSSYVYLCAQQMLSADGQCKSFGKGGNGFVPGEGVGVVLLKRLSRAIADQDHIYAVIRGTSINHGGKTNGYTVPNPKAQGELIKSALDKAGISARTISYIEAHGTGTELGDPIEITGLTQAFRADTEDMGFCAIGSAKSNIGHLEAAAGIAGLTKIVLQMNHRKIVPSLHAKELNPNINFIKTPFVVQQEITEWKRPIIDGQEIPRRAGVSSFGAGGSNAHAVIEEYISDQEQAHITIDTTNPAIIVLSARNEERLKEYAGRLLAEIEEQQFADTSLADIAYTLQVGREAMEERLAVIVGSIKELEEKLRGFIEERKGIEDFYRGQVKQNKEILTVLTVDQEMQETIEKWIHHRKYKQLLDLWVRGLSFDWNKLYGDAKPCRISLPSYPFSKERFWLPENEVKAGNANTSPAVQTGFIHPLLHQNTSDFSEQRFSSTFTGQEFFLADHVVKEQRVLPGVAYLEMARAAVEQSLGTSKSAQTLIRLKNVVWVRPIALVDQTIRVNIGLFPEENGEFSYEIYSESEAEDAERVIHSQGSAVLGLVAKAPTLDLAALKAQCSEQTISSGQCYEAFKTMGLNYGPGHQGIKRMYIGPAQVLAELTLPSSVFDSNGRFVLHPGMMDSALQASIGLMIDSSDWNRGNIPHKPALPFALQEVEIFGNCTDAMWTLVRYSNMNEVGDKTHMRVRVQKFDIDLCDSQGNVCVRIKGFASRVLEGEVGESSRYIDSSLSMGAHNIGTLMLEPVWKEQAVARETLASDYAQHIVILCEMDVISLKNSQTQVNGAHFINLQSKEKEIPERIRTYAVEVFTKIQGILKDKPSGQVLIQIIISNQDEQQLFSGLSGLLKTAHLENSKLMGQLIEVEPNEDSAGIIRKLKENSRCPLDSHVRYRDGKRWVADLSEIEVSPEGSSLQENIPWRDGGVYLVTGGAGGLGLIFSNEIAHKVKDATLILTGRSSLDGKKHAQLKELEERARIVYKQVDVTQKEAVMELIRSIRNDFGNLNGIIHSAGVIRDNFILNKTTEEFQEVLSPKVIGLVYLDEASKDLDLDFFILFSSIAGSFGNPGQADYATANSFMDAYTEYRNTLVALEQRQGHTISINWPLWKEGGMHVDEATEKMMIQNMGMAPMETTSGIRAFYQSLVNKKDQVIVIAGKLSRIKEKLLSVETMDVVQQKKVSASVITTASEPDHNLLGNVQSTLIQAVSKLLRVKAEDIDEYVELKEYGFDSITYTEFANKLNQEYQLELTPTIFFENPTLNDVAKYLVNEYQTILASRYALPVKKADAVSDSVPAPPTIDLLNHVQPVLIQTVSQLLKVKCEDIDVQMELSEYGFDSITYTEFANKLNQEYKLELTPTVFFEHPNLHDVAKYLIEEYPAKFASKVAVQSTGEITEPLIEDRVKESVTSPRQRSRFAKTLTFPESKQASTCEPVAIIGMSGIFPGAKDVNEFWKNLLEGKDCITEIPKDRWDWREYYGDPVKETNKTNIKWGGFIDGVDEFDPLFFGISPKEAELMDPQQRLLMTHVWKTMEDAGVSAQIIAGTKTAIFAGVGNSGYNKLIYEANVPIEGYTSTGIVPSIGPNRMSYFLNIHGPSEPIETACSSSLVAIHRAVNAMENGTCEMAIVGGVNTIVTPEFHISFNKAGMLAEDGRCKTFSDQANGYVRGEGAGMIFLKKLSAAKRDGDHIYGVIRGTAENHGGRANSLTAPNPKAQAELLVTAYTKAGIDPRTVTYIEAHGTGTKLGDPIEINGLKTAFKELYQATGDPQVAKSYCGIGSVKTNIGHLELAAGIAGVIKVLLQLKHKTLVKSLHSDTVNPYIELKDSPFYIVRETEEWKAAHDVDGEELPRRAGVSSFGFGGANAHVVIEEYIERPNNTVITQNPAVIVLSAKNEDRLKEQVQQLLNVIGERRFPESSLADIAYTLQVGREPMEERLALVGGSIKELEEKLKGLATGQDNIPDLYRGQVKRNQETLAIFTADEDLQKAIEAWISKGKYAKLLDLWVKGLSFDWNKLYGEIKPRRISLPTYPFAKEHYWVRKHDRLPKTESKFTTSILDDQERTQSTNSQPYLQSIASTEQVSTNLFTKPAKISLHSLTNGRILSSKPIDQTQPSIRLSTTSISLSEPGINDVANHLSNVHTTISTESLQEELRTSLAEALCMERNKIDVDKKFVDMGLDSIVGVEWIRLINKQYRTSIPVTKVYDYPCIHEFAGFLEKELNKNCNQAGSSQELLGSSRSSSKVSVQPIELPLIESASVSRVLISQPTTTQAQANSLQTCISAESLQEELRASLAEALCMEQNKIGFDKKFVDLGLDSIVGVEWIRVINKQYRISIPVTKVYDYPSIHEFAGFLEKELDKYRNQAASSLELLGPSQSSSKVSLQPIESPLIEPTFTSRVLISRPTTTQVHANSLQTCISAESLQEELRTSLAEALYMERSKVDVDKKFIEMGLDSIVGVEWIRLINKQYRTSIPVTKVYDYPSIHEFAGFLEKELRNLGGGLIQSPLKSMYALSLDEVVQQVYQGNLAIEQADQIIQQLNIKDE